MSTRAIEERQGFPAALRALAGGVRGGVAPFGQRVWGAISGPPT